MLVGWRAKGAPLSGMWLMIVMLVLTLFSFFALFSSSYFACLFCSTLLDIFHGSRARPAGISGTQRTSTSKNPPLMCRLEERERRARKNMLRRCRKAHGICRRKNESGERMRRAPISGTQRTSTSKSPSLMCRYTWNERERAGWPEI